MVKRGFTLAEVLVTLLVIGVIAALTIPQLINSTEDRQYKTAYKKAVSSIANATELMEANEVSCSVATNSDLAKCMKNAMKGTVTDEYGNPDDNGNILITQDGMAFAFFLPFNYADQMAQLQADDENYKAPKRAISKICPDYQSDLNYMDNVDDNCFVLLDLDGFGKNSTSFKDIGLFDVQEGENIDFDAFATAGDLQILGFSGKGEVRPYVTPDDGGDALNLDINKGYKYLYGEDALKKLLEEL